MAPKACTHSRSSFWSGESIQPAIALFNCCPCLNEGKHAKINRLLFFRTIRLQLRHRHHHLPLGLLEGHHHSTLSYNCFLNLVGVSSPSRHRDLLPNVKKKCGEYCEKDVKGWGLRKEMGYWTYAPVIWHRYLVSDILTSPVEQSYIHTHKRNILRKNPLPISLFTYYYLQIKFVPLLKR